MLQARAAISYALNSSGDDGDEESDSPRAATSSSTPLQKIPTKKSKSKSTAKKAESANKSGEFQSLLQGFKRQSQNYDVSAPSQATNQKPSQRPTRKRTRNDSESSLAEEGGASESSSSEGEQKPSRRASKSTSMRSARS